MTYNSNNRQNNKISILYYLNDNIVIRRNLNLMIGEVSEICNTKYFFRCHRSFIVNLRHIISYGDYPSKFITTINGKQIPLSRSKKLEFHNQFRKLDLES